MASCHFLGLEAIQFALVPHVREVGPRAIRPIGAAGKRERAPVVADGNRRLLTAFVKDRQLGVLIIA